MHSLILIFFLSFQLVQSQVQTEASCEAQESYMKNGKGQDPCTVAAYLLSVCNGGVWDLPELSDITIQRYYAPPELSSVALCANCSVLTTTSVTTTVSDCSCSSVTWWLVQGCSFCQAIGFSYDWDTWITNCDPSITNVGHYPHTIPNQVAVPAWVTISLTESGFDFNQTLIQNVAAENKPDFTGDQLQPPAGSSVKSPPTSNPPSKTGPSSTNGPTSVTGQGSATGQTTAPNTPLIPNNDSPSVSQPNPLGAVSTNAEVPRTPLNNSATVLKNTRSIYASFIILVVSLLL